MRRLLAVLALVATLPVAPSHGAPPPGSAGKAVQHVPGRITFGEHAVHEREHRVLETLAVTPESRELLRRLEVAMAKAPAGEDIRLATAVSVPDLDGDRVGDLVMVDMKIWIREYRFDGDTTIAVFSGRTGRQVWRRAWEDFTPMIYWAKVGNGLPGLVLADGVGTRSSDWGYRFVGVTGHGRTVYDKTVSADDGRGGEVQFGGFMNAFTGGGTDILIGRVERVVGFGLSLNGVTPPGVDFTQAYVLDGKDGAIVSVSDRVFGVGGDPAFVAVGDLDADKRDDYAMFRFGVHEEIGGSVVARSVVENKLLWTNDALPVGRSIAIMGAGDFVADRRGDLMYQTWMSGAPLVEVSPITDEMPLFHGGLAGTHAVMLDGRDGSLERRLSDGTNTLYLPFQDVDRDGKVDIVTVAWTSTLRQVGLSLALLTKAGDVVRWKRDIMVDADVPGAITTAGAWLDAAGDVDRDGFGDWSYEVTAGATSLTMRKTSGFLFPRTGSTLSTPDRPLQGTLDGRGSDRYGYALKKDTQTWSMRDGRSGASFWRVSATSKPLGFGVMSLAGQRGRCDGVVLLGMGTTRETMGPVWATVLDGTTGRVRWSKALNERVAAPHVVPHGGRPARCA